MAIVVVVDDQIMRLVIVKVLERWATLLTKQCCAI